MLTRIRSVFQEYPRSFWVLMGGGFIDRTGTNLILPFLAVYIAKKFDAPMTQIAIVFTIFAISNVIGNLLAGALTDKFGRRAILISGLVLGGLSRIGLGLAADMPTIYAVSFVAGLFSQVGFPAMTAMIADMLPPSQHSDGFGIQRVVVNASWVLGPFLGGFLAPIVGYLTLFVADAITSLIMAAIVFVFIPETLPEKRVDQKPETFGQTLIGYRRVLTDGLFMSFVGVSIITLTAYMQMYGPLSVYMVRSQHMPEAAYGTLLAVNSAMVVFLQFPISRWSSARPALLMIVLGTVLYGVGLTAYALPANQPIYIGAMVVITLGEMLVTPTGQALTTILSPEDMRGRYVAIQTFTWWGIPQALGPILAGLIMDNMDPRWVWYLCGILCAVSAAGFYAIHLRGAKRIGAQTHAVRVAAEDAPAPL